MERLTTVRYWAAIKEAAGVAEEQVDAASVAQALELLRARHSERFGVVLERCSLLLDGTQVAGRDLPLEGGQLLDCLPPFAGG